MGKPVARGSRLIAVAVALVGVSASLLAVQVSALDSISVDRAELDDGVLRVEGQDAVPRAIVRVTSAESSASSPADNKGRFRVLASNFRSSNCQVTVTDGATSAQVSLDECTPTAPPTTPPTTTTTSRPTTTTTTSAADDHHHDHDHDDDASAADDHHHDHDDDASAADDHHHDDAAAADDRATDAGDVHRSARPRAAALFQRAAQHGGRDVCADRDRVRSQPGDLAEQGVHRVDHLLQPAERERHVHRDRYGSAGTAPHPRSLPAVREPVARTEYCTGSRAAPAS